MERQLFLPFLLRFANQLCHSCSRLTGSALCRFQSRQFVPGGLETEAVLSRNNPLSSRVDIPSHRTLRERGVAVGKITVTAQQSARAGGAAGCSICDQITRDLNLLSYLPV